MSVLCDVDWLAAHLEDRDLRVADVRWVLGKPGAGEEKFRAGRIPGAVHLDVDRDLAEHAGPERGRHPLPSPERLVATLAARGIGPATRVVVYDDVGGAHAGRLWWLLRWLGIQALLLDGGFPAWVRTGQRIEDGPPRAPRPVPPWTPRTDDALLVDKQVVMAASAAASSPAGGTDSAETPTLLLDARPADRFRGENESLDPRAGHIPGARSAPFAGNLDGSGRFLPPDMLRARFAALGVRDASEVIVSCGSGITACHDLIALEVAGLGTARLYPGSFSEWANDPSLPVAPGDA